MTLASDRPKPPRPLASDRRAARPVQHEQADDEDQPDQARQQGLQQAPARLGGGDLDVVGVQLLGDRDARSSTVGTLAGELRCRC